MQVRRIRNGCRRTTKTMQTGQAMLSFQTDGSVLIMCRGADQIANSLESYAIQLDTTEAQRLVDGRASATFYARS